ncbi:PKD domain-containing protein [Candidatus Bathyarchaeota archaeon]|nr:PKD domain-containing protein [Candidatus Bathyarchaeota archaeon]
MNRKIILLAIIAQLLIIAAIPKISIALASPTLTISPSEHQATIIGEHFTVGVTIADLDQNWRLIALQFRIQYDSALLEAIDVQEGSFMQQWHNSAEQPYTYFINYTENNNIYGPSVIVGILNMPNANGQWNTFAQGSGTLASITFRTISQPAATATSALTLNNTLLIDDDLNEIPHTTVNANYQVEPLTFSYQPTQLIAGKPVLFTAPQSTQQVTYQWNFDDGTAMNVTSNTVGHVYSTPGDYNVALTCTSQGFTSATTTNTITANPTQPSLDMTVDAGSLHFRGEIAEFNVLVTIGGEAVNPTKLEAFLYLNGNQKTDLTSSIQNAGTGYYVVQYTIPADAETGTYTLLIKAEYYNAKGTTIKSFQMSQTLTAEITNITNGIATVSNGVTQTRLDLNAINATIVGVVKDEQGVTRVQISTTAGTLTARLDTINATVTQVNGDTATLQTSLGEIKTKLGETQSTQTTTLYIIAIVAVIAVILAAIMLLAISARLRAL